MAYQLDNLRLELHHVLIAELQKIYQNDSWKYRFLQDVELHFNMRIGYKQLTSFEDGVGKNENIIVMIISLLQIYNNKNTDVSIRFSKKGSFSVHKS